MRTTMSSVAVDAEKNSRCVEGVVRFFNAGKGYGKVAIMNNEAYDAFLHCSTLFRCNMPIPASGDILECEVNMNERGPEVVSVHKVTPRNDEQPRPRQEGAPYATGNPGPTVSGAVKFFDFEKSFGFLTTEHGDVFIHMTTLTRAGIPGAYPGDRFVCDTVKTEKGLMASSVTKAP